VPLKCSLVLIGIRMGVRYPSSNSVVPVAFALRDPKGGICPNPNASLFEMLKSIRTAGFDAVEVSLADLVAYNKDKNSDGHEQGNGKTLLSAALAFRKLSQNIGLDILLLKPFTHAKVWKLSKAPKEREILYAETAIWLDIMETLGTNILLSLKHRIQQTVLYATQIQESCWPQILRNLRICALRKGSISPINTGLGRVAAHKVLGKRLGELLRK